MSSSSCVNKFERSLIFILNSYHYRLHRSISIIINFTYCSAHTSPNNIQLVATHILCGDIKFCWWENEKNIELVHLRWALSDWLYPSTITTKQVWSIHSHLIHMNAYWIMVKFCVALDLQLQILLVKKRQQPRIGSSVIDFVMRASVKTYLVDVINRKSTTMMVIFDLYM